MRTQEFQQFLLRSAVIAMACDGNISSTEIEEIKKMVRTEIYFLGYDFEEPLSQNLDLIKTYGITAINQYLSEVSAVNLTDKQALILIEVLLRTIEADGKVEQREIKFVRVVKSNIGISDEALITKFPSRINYLMDFHNSDLNENFTDEIKFD